MTHRILLAFALLLSACLFAQTLFAQNKPAAFDGLDKWKGALAVSDFGVLKVLYSSNPAARFVDRVKREPTDIAPETDFWQKLILSGASNFVVSTIDEQDQQGLHIISLAIAMTMSTPDGPRTRYVMEEQAWQRQGENWRIVVASHGEVVKMRPALTRNPNLYGKDADARGEIKEAVALAAKDHQRVILVFGANWCYDCHVLDQAFHEPDVASVLEKNFRVVHVDIGSDGSKNGDLAAQYEVPLDKGVPALAVLGPDGTLLYSQKNGEWESAQSLDPDDVIAFLKKWKP